MFGLNHWKWLAVSLGLVSAARVSAAEPEVPATSKETAETLRACFEAGLRKHVQAKRLRAMPSHTEYTDLYLAQRYAEQLLAQGEGDASASPCTPSLVDDYVKAFLAAQENQGKDKAKDLGQPGSRPLEVDSDFIRIGNSLMAAHVRGHSDITLAALDSFKNDEAFSKDARDLLEWSSQAADLYYWSDHHYHAHSTECGKGSADTCASSARSQQAGYPGFLAARLKAVREALALSNTRAVPRALFELGGLIHAVQDLVYHRGMTMTHHAGLSYVLKQNPDVPEDKTLEMQRFADAQQLTQRVLTLVRAQVGEEAWKKLSKWKQPASYRGHKSVATQFKHNQDMTLAALIEYVASARVYVTGERPKQELDLAAAGFWKPDEVILALETQPQEP